MKKGIAILIFLVLIAASAFAEGFSLKAGGGLILDLSFHNGSSSSAADSYEGYSYLKFGGYGFFDATFVEADISIVYYSMTSVTKKRTGYLDDDWSGTAAISFSIMAKLPIGLRSITVFPLIGINYNLVLNFSNTSGMTLVSTGDFNQFGILAGGGFDFFFSRALFLRTEALFTLRFAGGTMKNMASTTPGGDTTLGMGPRVKTGIGYRF